MHDTQKTGGGVTAKRPRAESYCTHHCSTCKGHFSSLTAFDAHRRGEFMPKDGERSRHCVDLEEYAAETADKPKAVAKWLYRNGVCELAKPGSRLEDVLVWGEAGTRPEGIFDA